jgi:hypothetical protein
MLAALCLVAGCGGEPPPEIPQALTEEAAPSTLTEAFAKATGETREMADDAVTFLSSKEYDKALLVLQRLLSQTDLTPHQRSFTSQALLTANQKVNEAAQQGNERAARLLQQRAATK